MSECKHEFEEGYVGKVWFVCKKCHTLKSELYALELQKERDELRKQLAEYEQLNMMQLEAGERAAKLYNEKNGTDIGQLDLARGTVFLMEENELQAQVAVLRGALEEVPSVFKKLRNGLGAGGQSTGLYVEVELGNVLLDAFEDEFLSVSEQALSTTPAEAIERVQKLVEALDDCRNLISKTEFPTVAEQADKALAEWKGEKA